MVYDPKANNDAAKRAIQLEYGKLFGYLEARRSRLYEKVNHDEYTEADMEALDAVESSIRALIRITYVAECALYGDVIDYYEMMQATND